MSWLLSWRPAELPNSWASEHGWTLARVLIVVAMLACLGFAAVASPRLARGLSVKVQGLVHWGLMAVLGLGALLSVAVYLDFGVFRYGSYLNEWDFYHYYLGTKYAPELGYEKLYGATLLADGENGLRYRNPHNVIRDLRTAEIVPVQSVTEQPGRYLSGFDSQRWREFVADVTWFKQQLPAERWSLLLVDHGYNGTPAWSFVVGGLLSRHLSVRGALGRWLMLLLDPALLLGTVGAVAWAFGRRTAFLLAIFVGTHYLMSWGHLKGALLRTDFAMCAALAVCFVKKQHFKLAGVLLGWAILSRVFPVFFLVGPGVLLVWRWLETRKLPRTWLALLTSCAATVALVVAGSCLYFGGIDIWREWSHKITLHYASGSDWDLGYRTIVEAAFVHGVPVRPEDVGQASGWTLPTMAAALLLIVPAAGFLRALEDYQAVAYGFVFVFVLSLATYYYYAILCVPFLFFAPELEKLQSALGAAFMFFCGLAGYVLFSGWRWLADSWVLFRGWHQTFPTYYFSSCLIAVTVAQMLWVAGTRARQMKAQSPSSPSRLAQPQLPIGGASVEKNER